MGAIKNLEIEIQDAILNDSLPVLWDLEKQYGEDTIYEFQMGAVAGLFLQGEIKHASSLWRNCIEHFFDPDLPWISESIRKAHNAGLDQQQIQTLINLCAAYYAKNPDVAIAKWERVSLV